MYCDPSQIVNVSYGTMFNCLPCGKGSVDSQHLSRCPNACAHKKETRVQYGRWLSACRQSREHGTLMPPPFRPPNPVDFVTKTSQKAGQAMIPPTLIRAYPGDQAFGAYETLRASVGPSGDYFPQEPPRMDGISALAPFRIPSGQLITPYASGYVHPFPSLQPFQPQTLQTQPQDHSRYAYRIPDFNNSSLPYGGFGTPLMGAHQPQMVGVSGLSPHQAGMFQAPYHAVPSRPWVSTVPSGGSSDPPRASTQESLSSSDSVSVTPKAAKKRRAKVKSTKKKTPARKTKAYKKTPAASTRSKAKK
jgi:hypothetical protein